MKSIFTASLVVFLAIVSEASGQTTVFSHDFENAIAGDLSGMGALGTPSAGSLLAPGGFISSTRPAYTTGNNGDFNRITTINDGSFNDVGSPAGNFLTVNLSEPAAVTGVLAAGETTTIDFNLASFGSNNTTLFKYMHVIGRSSTGAEVFQILYRSGSGAATRQLFARELGQDNTTFTPDDVVLDNTQLFGVFSAVDGTLVLENTSFNINSTNTDSAPSGQVVVNIVIDENGWNVSAAPSGGGSVTTPATGLGIASGATDLASIEFFTSLNDSLSPQNNGFWLDNIVVTTDQTVDGGDIVKGDVDLSGTVDFFDIQPFIDVLSTPDGFQDEADADCNGVVNFFDIQPFIDILAGG